MPKQPTSPESTSEPTKPSEGMYEELSAESKTRVLRGFKAELAANAADPDEPNSEEFYKKAQAMQMFDPPFKKPVAVAGRPVFMIPDSETEYPSFLAWWMEVGRLTPTDPQGWGSISGPWVMGGRVEIIPPEDWEALPETERMLIRVWADTMPPSFYD